MHAVIHLYNSTSVAQREQVFKKNKEEIKKIAVDGAILLNELAKETEGNFTFEYSPESFQGTEVDYALEVCNAVLRVWEPSRERKVIINLPTTVENAMPHVFASQVEYMSKHLYNREHVLLSLHPHNDRGSGVSDAELGILAGADRIEGTLFGNGERTGNVDIITVAMNMYSQGVDPGLDFSNMSEISETYERPECRFLRDSHMPENSYFRVFRFSPGCDRKRNGIKERREAVPDVDGSLPSSGSKRCGTPLRDRCDPYQQSVGKRRSQLYFKTELWNQPSAENEGRGRLSCKGCVR